MPCHAMPSLPAYFKLPLLTKVTVVIIIYGVTGNIHEHSSTIQDGFKCSCEMKYSIEQRIFIYDIFVKHLLWRKCMPKISKFIVLCKTKIVKFYIANHTGCWEEK
jgi:hypothetical protein